MAFFIDSNPIPAAVRPRLTPISTHPVIINFEKSHGPYLHDDHTGTTKLDFACHYASLPLGYNLPELHDPAFEADLMEVSRHKIANLDVLTPHYAKFIETFSRVQGEGFCRYFFIDGGALGVENAMKAAFDWKVRKNLTHGRGERGFEIMHFRQAFHGRSGYTVMCTNTADPNKYRHFPRFEWPRITNPRCKFPLEGDHLEETLALERAAMREIDEVLAEKAEDIAAILIEPIQGEGGDNHFRTEFLQFLRQRCDEFDILLIFDEVQCGMGITGDPWAWRSIGVKPDLVAFAKKAQVGGFMAGDRLMSEPHNVFTVPSRISSTWGASLPDMVRVTKYLEIYERDNILGNVRDRGAELLSGLERIAEETELIENVRGRGLMIAFDLTSPDTRSEIIADLGRNGLVVLPCGTQSIRFRPPLNIKPAHASEALDILERTLKRHPAAEPVHSL